MNRKLVFHPFFFAIYAILAVYSRNSMEVPVQWVVRPLLILLVLTSAIFCFLKKKLGDAQYAGLVTTLVLFWLFFGHFHRTLYEKSSYWNSIIGVLIAFLIWTAPLAAIGSKWAWKKIRNRGLVTSFLNVTSILVVLLPVYITGGSWLQTILQTKKYDAQQIFSSTTLEPQALRPDIYLIILDAYGREDFLQEVYGFDNGHFISYLEEKGFYVADQSSSNYPMTVLSLSSLLNMHYLDGLTDDFRNTGFRGPLNNLIQQSDVRRLLGDSGYKYIAFPTASLSTQMRDADIYLDMTAGNLNEFEGLLLSSTLANLAIEAWDLNVPVPGYSLYRRYILFSLEKLETISKEVSPKFVFVHIMAPHPPFVLDEMGNPIQPARPFNFGDASAFMGSHEEYLEGYIDEIQYLNERLIYAIDKIIDRSKQPPIIIVQGDHGPGIFYNMMELDGTCLRERYSILNAYYFPDRNYVALYPTITPVNSFRVVFNQYFGGKFELLVDKSYFAGWSTPYLYSDVSDQVQSCEVKP